MHLIETNALTRIVLLALMLNVGKKLRPISWVAFSLAALLYVFDVVVPLSVLPVYLVVRFATETLAIAIACADRFWFDRWRGAKT